MHTIRFRDSTGEVRTGELSDEHISSEGMVFTLSDVAVLPPTEPSKVLGTGPNYYSNIEHYGRDEPESPADLLLFVKAPPHVLVGHGGIATLRPAGEFYFEAELGVVIGERCQDVSSDEAMEYVDGYTCVNEITNKGIEESQFDQQNLVRSKSFDDSAPIGPVIASPDEVPKNASIELRLNDELQQRDKISNLIHPVPDLIEEFSRYMTLEPGDVIATGSPEGVAQLSDGDHVEVTIEGIGTLEHGVSIPERKHR